MNQVEVLKPTCDKSGNTDESVTCSQAKLKNEFPQFIFKANGAVKAGKTQEAVHILKHGTQQNTAEIFDGDETVPRESLGNVEQCSPHAANLLLRISHILADNGRQQHQIIDDLSQIISVQTNMELVRLLVEVMLQMNAHEQAIENVRQIVENNPSRIDAKFELATTYKKTRKTDLAIECYRDILKQEPCAAVYNELGLIYMQTGRLSDAIESLKKGIEVFPDNEAELSINIVSILMNMGKNQEALTLLRKILNNVPEDGKRLTYSNFLLHLHHQPEIDAKMIFDEHKEWARLFAPVDRIKTQHDNVIDVDRRLRIGYISPDFRRHSVSHFFKSLLNEHDNAAFEVYGYGNVGMPDKTTEQIKQKCDYYRNIHGVSDNEVVRMIEQDQIDILVDLAGHTGENRLGVLTYKPAPVQVTYLGYPDTTGMKAVDYRLTDKHTESEQSQQFNTEELIFLPDGFLCYCPPDFAPLAAPLPAVKNGFITFGSFNNNSKISPTTISLWAQILKANKNSRLLLKFRGGDVREVKEYCLHRLEQLDIPPQRVTIHGQKPPAEHLSLYSNVDIALDTYPYHGTTTTCEALWMGVPVISLIGQNHISRVGLSILRQLGLEFFGAASENEYVAKATALAANPDALMKIRATMRQRMGASTLCDAKSFTQNVETAYREMWTKWCKSQSEQEEPGNLCIS